MFKNFTELNELLKHIPWNRAFLEEDVDICNERVNDLLLDAAICAFQPLQITRKFILHGLSRILSIRSRRKKGYGKNWSLSLYF